MPRKIGGGPYRSNDIAATGGAGRARGRFCNPTGGSVAVAGARVAASAGGPRNRRAGPPRSARKRAITDRPEDRPGGRRPRRASRSRCKVGAAVLRLPPSAAGLPPPPAASLVPPLFCRVDRQHDRPARSTLAASLWAQPWGTRFGCRRWTSFGCRPAPRGVRRCALARGLGPGAGQRVPSPVARPGMPGDLRVDL